MRLPLTLILPIMAPLPRDRAQRELQDEALDDLRIAPQLLPLGSDFGGSSIQIRVADDPSQEPLLKGAWEAPIQVRQYRLLVVEVDVHTCAENIRRGVDASTEEEFTVKEVIRLSQQHAITCLQLEVNTILLLANILRPGSLSADVGYAFIGDEQCGTTKPFFAEHLFSAVEASREQGWPPLFKADFLSGWKWLRETFALVDGIGVGRIGRALAAVSHLTTPDLRSTSSVSLVWILLGLEALYSKGNVGLKEQLLGKTEAILGPRKENKKAFGIVYDFRSRFLHGDVDLPLRFTEFDAVQKYEDFHAELYRNESLALAVLLATLQWMVTRNATDLAFEYSVARLGGCATT